MSRPGALLLTSLTLCVAASSTRGAAQGTNPPPPPVKEPAHGFVGQLITNYTGDRYLDKRNGALAPGFTTLDAGAGYRLDRWELRVDGRNLGNGRDAASESEPGDAQCYLLPARWIDATVAVSF